MTLVCANLARTAGADSAAVATVTALAAVAAAALRAGDNGGAVNTARRCFVAATAKPGTHDWVTARPLRPTAAMSTARNATAGRLMSGIGATWEGSSHRY